MDIIEKIKRNWNKIHFFIFIYLFMLIHSILIFMCLVAKTNSEINQNLDLLKEYIDYKEKLITKKQ